MSDVLDPNAIPSAPDDSTGGGTGGGTQAPEGFVPLADLEREQARARSFQSELDRAKAQLASASPAPKKEQAAATGDTQPVFDPQEFRASLMKDILGAQELASAVSDLRTQFPHADPALFSRAAEFGNAHALRIAVEDSHTRVAGILDAEKKAIEERLRSEMGNVGGGTPAGAPVAPQSDPTVDQLLSLDMPALQAYKAANPGVVERVLRSAS